MMRVLVSSNILCAICLLVFGCTVSSCCSCVWPAPPNVQLLTRYELAGRLLTQAGAWQFSITPAHSLHPGCS